MTRDIGKGPWRKGPPPSVGWWPADVHPGQRDILRWWNGSKWSAWTHSDDSAKYASQWASKPLNDYYQDKIMWRQRADWWPERSKT